MKVAPDINDLPALDMSSFYFSFRNIYFSNVV